MGKAVSLPQIQWTSSEEWAAVDDNHILYFSGSGALTLTAALIGEPSITASVSTLVNSEIQVGFEYRDFEAGPTLYPNPAADLFHVSGVEQVNLYLYESTGKLLRLIENYNAGDAINIQELSSGLYLLRIGEGSSAFFLKLLIQ
jgi:hypothetical protein